MHLETLCQTLLTSGQVELVVRRKRGVALVPFGTKQKAGKQRGRSSALRQVVKGRSRQPIPAAVMLLRRPAMGMTGIDTNLRDRDVVANSDILRVDLF